MSIDFDKPELAACGHVVSPRQWYGDTCRSCVRKFWESQGMDAERIDTEFQAEDVRIARCEARELADELARELAELEGAGE